MSRRVADKETGLTPQQEAFCVEVVRTGNQSEAYRIAYPKSYRNPNSLAVRASELASKPKIRVRIDSLRVEARRFSGITLADHLEELQRLKLGAVGVDQYSAAITAEVSRGKVSGLYDGAQDEDSPAPRRIVVEIVDGRK